jgi:hypothetical protein
VILEHLGQFSGIREQVGLLITGQAVKGGIGGNKEGERARPPEGFGEASDGLNTADELIVLVLGPRGFEEVCHLSEMSAMPSFSSCVRVLLASPAGRVLSVEDR